MDTVVYGNVLVPFMSVPIVIHIYVYMYMRIYVCCSYFPSTYRVFWLLIAPHYPSYGVLLYYDDRVRVSQLIFN